MLVLLVLFALGVGQVQRNCCTFIHGVKSLKYVLFTYLFCMYVNFPCLCTHTHVYIYIYIHLYIHIDLQTCMCMVQFFPCLFIVSDPQVFLMMVHWNTWKNHEKHLRRSTTIWSTWPKVDWPLEMRACCWMSRIIFSKGWTNVVFWWTGFG